MRPSPPCDSRAATSRCRQATRNSSCVQDSARARSASRSIDSRRVGAFNARVRNATSADTSRGVALVVVRALNEAWKDSAWGALVWLAMILGPRRGELSALRWSHLDLQRGVVAVGRSIGQLAGQTWERTPRPISQLRVTAHTRRPSRFSATGGGGTGAETSTSSHPNASNPALRTNGSNGSGQAMRTSCRRRQARRPSPPLVGSGRQLRQSSPGCARSPNSNQAGDRRPGSAFQRRGFTSCQSP